jgi:hypothetical protein
MGPVVSVVGVLLNVMTFQCTNDAGHRLIDGRLYLGKTCLVDQFGGAN